MQKEGLLSHNASNISFHNVEEVIQEGSTSVAQWMPKDVRHQIGAYVMLNIIQLSICYKTLQYLHSEESVLVTTIDFTTLKTIFMTLIILAYTKYCEPALSTLDPEHNRLIIGLTCLSLIANLSTSFAFTILPFTQAASFAQLVPALIGMMSYLLITPTDQKIFLFVGGQVLMTFLFQATTTQLLIMLLSPHCLSFMSILRQVVIRPINQFTALLFGGLLHIPILMFLTIGFGSVSNLTNAYIIMGAALTSAFQFLSYLIMTEIIRTQMPTKEIWNISAGTIALTIPIQLVIFNQPLGVVPLVGQLVILISSVLQD